MMTVQVYNTVVRQYVWSSVWQLLDNYYRFGFLYDDCGNLKPEYINIGCEILEDNSEGPLEDADGYEMAVEKYIVEEYFEQPDKYRFLNPYLDVHSNIHFDDQDWADIKNMHFSKIKQKFIGDSMKKLVAMLRRGHNYAMTLPVESALSDEYLEDTICFVWQMLVLDTLNVHDVKKKYFVPGHEYYKKGEENKYDWDSRPYYDRIIDLTDVVFHKNGSMTITYNTNQNHNKTANELETERKAFEAQLIRVVDISKSPSDKEKSLVNKFSEITENVKKNFSESDQDKLLANVNSMAKRMAHIYKIY